MNFKVPTLVAAMICAPTAFAADKHVHDQGEVFIINEGKQWNVQFNIPAINAFGFEHRAEDKQQQAAVTKFAKLVQTANDVVSLNASCKLVSATDNVEKQFALAAHAHDKHDDKHEHHDHDKHDHDKHEHHDHDKHDHDKHDHDKHEHHDHDKHDHDKHEHHDHDKHDHDKHEHHDHDKHDEHNHADAEFSYVFECDKSVTSAEFNLFKSLPTLTLLEAQWIVGSAQGAKPLTPQASSISFK
ncbi:DUF2796 domain-containing protein [Shewanella maritima]|uniref:DUF2796 domain-containing protein n=1 Tax=Shewanella maritima TaxID=2520507 RepID=A0A411PDR6_9GAMM|nr:DUF2796 domain-containing protein [Shewanella maritima]QBF81699.1 DUF2796 domain-containing protein [Shewanella maritima]